LFTAVLEPMLRQWLDANLPEICERIAQAEIRRLTGQP
jgi:cell pole-organizing protein PopZ